MIYDADNGEPHQIKTNQVKKENWLAVLSLAQLSPSLFLFWSYLSHFKSDFDWTKFTKPNLQNQIYKIKFTYQSAWNVKSQIYQTQSFQSNLQNKIRKNKSRETESTEKKVSPIPAWAELGPAQPQLVLLWFSVFNIKLALFETQHNTPHIWPV